MRKYSEKSSFSINHLVLISTVLSIPVVSPTHTLKQWGLTILPLLHRSAGISIDITSQL